MESSGEKKKLRTNCTAVHNKVEINAQEQLVPRSTSTRGHLNKFIQLQTKVDPYKTPSFLTQLNYETNFLQRNLRQCSKAIKSKAYLAFVRPIFDYASVVWSPHTNSNINTLQMVQRKAARCVFGDFSTYSSVSSMLQELQWNSLQERRRQARLIMFYKILHKLVEVDFDTHLHPIIIIIIIIIINQQSPPGATR